MSEDESSPSGIAPSKSGYGARSGNCDVNADKEVATTEDLGRECVLRGVVAPIYDADPSNSELHSKQKCEESNFK
jgi:hypothetical protein